LVIKPVTIVLAKIIEVGKKSKNLSTLDVTEVSNEFRLLL
tara:strand:+ start:9138 stop:9257 length:120 start_codon:yes stop_codon:yes gene_type:complete